MNSTHSKSPVVYRPTIFPDHVAWEECPLPEILNTYTEEQFLALERLMNGMFEMFQRTGYQGNRRQFLIDWIEAGSPEILIREVPEYLIEEIEE